MSKITLDLIKAVDKEQKSLSHELAAAVGMFARDEKNSVSERAEALRIACQYMPRKQGSLTDEQFVKSFVNNEMY